MAIFLFRMETDFVDYYHRFYDAVREGGSLETIRELRNDMVTSARLGVFNIAKFQAITIFILMALGPSLLKALNLSQLYFHLFTVDLIGAGLQVVFLALLNILFYLDKRRQVLILTATNTALNAILTPLSIALGPSFFGYGFAVAMLLTIGFAFVYVDQDFEDLEYQTFMLR